MQFHQQMNDPVQANALQTREAQKNQNMQTCAQTRSRDSKKRDTDVIPKVACAILPHLSGLCLAHHRFARQAPAEKDHRVRTGSRAELVALGSLGRIPCPARDKATCTEHGLHISSSSA
eukprot:5183597-Amphidinium_carterae.1